MNWDYVQPVKIYFGNGRRVRLPELLDGYKKPLLVTDPYFMKSGMAEEFSRLLGGTSVFSGVSANPDVAEVNACSAVIREQGIDCIIALGGGSSLDLAKAASIAQPAIEPFHRGKAAIPQEHLPVIAVPTTAGTGSEVTCVSVLTDRSLGKKSPIVSESFYPAAAIIDPELTVSMPPAVTASTGIDVLCHAVEGFWSRGHQPICDALAIHAIRNVFSWLPVAYREPENLKAREQMAEASLIAGLAFTLPKTTASHACSFPLTSIYHIPHGEACGLTLDFFVRVNAEDAHTAELVDTLGFPDAGEFADAVAELKAKLGLRRDLRDFALTDAQCEELVALSHHPNLENNPVKITDEILRRLYRGLLA